MIERDERNVDIWLDFARLALRNQDIDQAEECFTEIQAILGGTNLDLLNIHAALLI